MLSINMRRIGRFNISKPLIEDEQFTKMVLHIFSRIKVLRAYYDYHREVFVYVGSCDKFEETQVGGPIPLYELQFDAKTMEMTVVKQSSEDPLEMLRAVYYELDQLKAANTALSAELNSLKNSLPSRPVPPELVGSVEATPVKPTRKPRTKKPTEGKP